MGPTRTRVYRGGALAGEDFPVTAVSDHLAEPDTVVWVDYCDPSAEQLHELADELGFHELAVEDALEPHQRPKLDHYASHLFLSCHAARVDLDTGRLDQTEINAFINDRWLITVRKSEDFDFGAVLRRWDRSDVRVPGVSFLLYGLLDVVVDGYFDALEAFDEFLRRDQRGHLLRATDRAGPATALVPDAAGPCPVPSPGRPDAGDRERADAPQTNRLRGRDGPLLPERL